MLNASAPPGRELKYARYELERRFLVERPPPELAVRTVEITDRYLTGTRIRLRRATTVSGDGQGTVTYKLTQKIPAPNGGPGLITTFYINKTEHDCFTTLPANTIEKTRTSIPPMGVDLFSGPLAGLYLAEAEFMSHKEMEAFMPPAWTIAEVTHDFRFTGGQLAHSDRDDLRRALASYGIWLGTPN